MSLPDPTERPTVPLWPDAGQAFGLGRARTFELARRGELPFPVYRLGRSFRVPTAALRRVLGLGQGRWRHWTVETVEAGASPTRPASTPRRSPLPTAPRS
jgi:hypothetical protein